MSSSRLSSKAWQYPAIGTFIGALYVLLDEGVLDHISSRATPILIIHEFMDAVFPVLLGMSVGYGLYLLKRRQRLNESLSFKNEHLKRDMLFNIFISQVLHEIRNPMHNIAALLDDPAICLREDQKALLQRNLSKIDALKKHYSRWGTLLDEINPTQEMLFKDWFEQFKEEKLDSDLKRLDAVLSDRVLPVRVYIHPLLLELVLSSLFANAFEAIEKKPGHKAGVTIETVADDLDPGRISIRLLNTGSRFNDEILENQAQKPTDSQKGLGLGLLLAQKSLEQAGASLSLSNTAGKAAVTLHLRGEYL